jgi:hypothetical protein
MKGKGPPIFKEMPNQNILNQMRNEQKHCSNLSKTVNLALSGNLQLHVINMRMRFDVLFPSVGRMFLFHNHFHKMVTFLFHNQLALTYYF